MSKELIEAVAAEMNRLGYGYHESHAESIVLAAVIDMLKHHGGSFTINCNGEPVATLTLSDPAAQDQGEVQRLKIALRLSANRFDRLALEFPNASDMRWTASEWANEARSALAASTGQEGGKV